MIRSLLLAILYPASGLADLPLVPERESPPDWLLDDGSFKAGVFRTGNPDELVLENGLLRRTFRLAPNAATIGLDHQVTGHAGPPGWSLLRATKRGRTKKIMETRFDGKTELPDGWAARVSKQHPRSSVINEGKAGEIFTPPHTHALLEHALPPGVKLVETRIDPGNC